jgi:PiT family inorganic phosphate transporter
MPDSSLLLFILVVAVALSFAFANGFNDAANAIATVIGTRVLSPRAAIIMAAFLNLAGAATGTAVARTIGKGIVSFEGISLATVMAGVAAGTLWTFMATRYGMPISVTHSLVAGLLGAGLSAAGTGAIAWGAFEKVALSVVFAPLLGFMGAFAAMVALMWIFRRSAPDRVRGIFSNLQILSAAFMAYSHGKNDGQMPIGVITLALVIYTGRGQFWEQIPWVIVVGSSLAISLGTALGGWRVIRTLGLRVTALRPIHGFAAETVAASVIEVASFLGIPVSTTHSISSAVMGVGATRRLSAVRWGVARNIVAAWILTFPISAATGWIFNQIFAAIW